MGGTYPPMANAKEGEWNFKQDPAAAALVCSTWPTPVVFNGEGGSTNSGRRVTYEMPEHNPLTMAYRLYPGVGFAGDRLSWDSVSALVALRGAEPWYKVVSGGTNVTDPITGINVWHSKEDWQHSYLVLKARKPEIETVIEDMQTMGKGRPKNLKFDTNYYADAGMCQITFQGQRHKQGQWQDQAAESWIQYQHANGRKRLVTSYAVVCNDQHRLPRTLELLVQLSLSVRYRVERVEFDSGVRRGETPVGSAVARVAVGLPGCDLCIHRSGGGEASFT